VSEILKESSSMFQFLQKQQYIKWWTNFEQQVLCRKEEETTMTWSCRRNTR